MTLFLAPTAPPANIIVEAISSTDIQLSWDQVNVNEQNGVIKGYKVSWKREGLDTEVDVLNIMTYTVGGLDIYTAYNFSVLAYNDAGDGVSSLLREVRTESIGQYFFIIK